MLVDALRIKRLLVAAAALFIVCGLSDHRVPSRVGLGGRAQVAIGAAAAVLPPALVALCLGLVGHQRMPAQLGRNQAFSHAGAFSAAILIGSGSRLWGYSWIFYLLCAFAAGMVAAVFSIRAGDIDHRLARGSDGDRPGVEHSTPVYSAAEHRSRCL